MLKKVGDKVAADETIAEIETDKSALSVNSPQAGIIEEFLVGDGDNVTSGAKVAKLTTTTTTSSDGGQPKQETSQVNVEQPKESKPSSGASSVTVSTPSFPESVKDGIIRLTKKVGDQISADETIAEIETDKSNLHVNAPQAGVIEAYLVSDGDTVVSGAQVAKVNPSSAAKSAPPAPAAKKDKPSSEPKSSPKLAPSQAAKPLSSSADANKITGTRSETRVKMSRMRLKIAERLKDAQNTCAMLTTFNEIDMR